MGVSLPRRRILLQTPPAQPSFPAALIDYDLTADTLDPALTFTRSTIKNIFGSDGNSAQQSINALGVSYNPVTLVRRGRHLEPARTNVLRNNTMQGASAGVRPTNWTGTTVGVSTNGLTLGVNGVVTVQGLPCLELTITGTATAAGAVDIVFDGQATGARPISPSTTYCGSVYTQIVSGVATADPVLYGFTYDSGGAFLATLFGQSFTMATGALARTQKAAAAGATAAFAALLMKFSYTSGQVWNLTFRIAAPQLEAGSGASSVILTTNSAVARSGDVLQLLSLPPTFSQTSGTVAAEWELASDNPSAANVVSINDGTQSNENRLRYNFTPTAIDGAILVSGSAVAAPADTSLAMRTAGSILRAVKSYQVGDSLFITSNGFAAVSFPSSMPTVSRMTIGCNGVGSEQTNAYLRRIRYWPQRLSNNQCSRIAAGVA